MTALHEAYKSNEKWRGRTCLLALSEKKEELNLVLMDLMCCNVSFILVHSDQLHLTIPTSHEVLTDVYNTSKKTSFMDWSPFWENKRSTAGKEIPCILWNQKVQYRNQNSPPCISILSPKNLVYTLPSYFPEVKNCTSENVQYSHYNVIKICGMYLERLSIRWRLVAVKCEEPLTLCREEWFWNSCTEHEDLLWYKK